MPASYFLDTSALIARYLRRAVGHMWVEQICSPATQNVVFISAMTAAELSAALHALSRGRTIRRKTCDEALAVFWRQMDANEYRVIQVTSPMIRRAADLCATHPLRGYDAVQLASVLVARDEARASAATLGMNLSDPIFASEDNRLLDAALAEGFVTDNPLDHPNP